MSKPYVMTISRLTVDKLGVRLYDKVSAVIAELVANSYDADATEVEIKAPMGEYLAFKIDGKVTDRGFTIEVSDNGSGMTPEEVQAFYLKVGGERRNDDRRGDKSKRWKRKVMGRKGVGKLAPFGICEEIELITSGGDEIEGVDEAGKASKGFLTAHLILRRSEILTDEDKPYEPTTGRMDRKVLPTSGTRIVLRHFARRQVPAIKDFSRQLSQRFGIASANWKIKLVDLGPNDAIEEGEGKKELLATVGAFQIETMPNTKIEFKRIGDGDGDGDGETFYAYAPDGNILSDIRAGFTHEEDFYPVTGWIAYAKENYKDDLMAGVRIYCRGKIAAQTAIFGRESGFFGEYSIRSYLVGEIHADWLDEKEDLIQTDRRDILWSDDLGQAFEEWGQSVVLKIGKLSRDPLRAKSYESFRSISNIDERIAQTFPLAEQKNIRENAIEFARIFGQKMRQDEVQDAEQIENVVQLTLFLAPHVTLDDQLKRAAAQSELTLSALTSILKTAQIAELSSYGRIAQHRVRVIDNLEQLKDDKGTLEGALQELIEGAPWLIDPQWSPLVANRAFSTLKTEFQKFYYERTGEEIVLDNFSMPKKRADFVLSSQDNVIQIIEIKAPKHAFQDEEMERMMNYHRLMSEFLSSEVNKEFVKSFNGFHITLVCDALNLSYSNKILLKNLIGDELTHIDWKTFLLRTHKAHQSFLDEAERQKRYAVRTEPT